MHLTCKPSRSRQAAVPCVATILNPNSRNRRASSTTSRLSRSFTLTKTVPVSGKICPADSCALAKASPKVSADPITSPVDFISGPRIGYPPGKRAPGNTGKYTHDRRQTQECYQCTVQKSVQTVEHTACT